MHIGIFTAVVLIDSLDHALRLLARGVAIEIDEVRMILEDRKHGFHAITPSGAPVSRQIPELTYHDGARKEIIP